MRRKKSQTTLLRQRNKELREARKLIQKLSASPSYTLSFLRRAVKEVESNQGRIGTTVAVLVGPRFTLGLGSTFSSDYITDKNLLVLKDEA